MIPGLAGLAGLIRHARLTCLARKAGLSGLALMLVLILMPALAFAGETGSDCSRYRYLVAIYPNQDTTGLQTVILDSVTYILLTEYDQDLDTNQSQMDIDGLAPVDTSWTYLDGSGSLTYEWAGYDENWIASTGFTVSADVPYYRAFFYTRLALTLSFDLQAPATGPDAVTNALDPAFEEQSVLFGEPLAAYAPPPGTVPVRPGYEFLGWFADAAATVPFDFAQAMPADDIIAYAAWKPILNDPGPNQPGDSYPGAASSYRTGLWDSYQLAELASEVQTQTESLPDTSSELLTADIAEDEVPLFSIGGVVIELTSSYSWSLANLILAVSGCIASVVYLGTYFNKRRQIEEAPEPGSRRYRIADFWARVNRDYRKLPEITQKRLLGRIVAAALAVFAVMIFTTTQDMSLPIALIDKWTAAHLVIMAIQIFCWSTARRKKELAAKA